MTAIWARFAASATRVRSRRKASAEPGPPSGAVEPAMLESPWRGCSWARESERPEPVVAEGRVGEDIGAFMSALGGFRVFVSVSWLGVEVVVVVAWIFPSIYLLFFLGSCFCREDERIRGEIRIEVEVEVDFPKLGRDG